MSDWEMDPEMKALRREFVASLPARIGKIRAALSPGAQISMALSELRHQAHKLAGLGGSYGYPLLSELASAVEDQIDANPKLDPCEIEGTSEWLAELERIATTFRKK